MKTPEFIDPKKGGLNHYLVKDAVDFDKRRQLANRLQERIHELSGKEDSDPVLITDLVLMSKLMTEKVHLEEKMRPLFRHSEEIHKSLKEPYFEEGEEWRKLLPENQPTIEVSRIMSSEPKSDDAAEQASRIHAQILQVDAKLKEAEAAFAINHPGEFLLLDDYFRNIVKNKTN